MSKLKVRVDILEKSATYCGHRPSGMTHEDFVLYWSQMKPYPRETFLHAMTDQDLDDCIIFLQGDIHSPKQPNQSHAIT